MENDTNEQSDHDENDVEQKSEESPGGEARRNVKDNHQLGSETTKHRGLRKSDSIEMIVIILLIDIMLLLLFKA